MKRHSWNRPAFLKAAGLTAAATAFGAPVFIPKLGEAADAIKIGLIDPVTGTYAEPGENEINGFAMAADAWNKRGGILGRKVELVKEDDASDPGVAVTKARKLVNQDKCVAIVGTVSSASSLSVSGATNSMNVIFIDSGGHTDDVTGKDCHWNTFRVCHSTWMESHAIGKTLLKKFGKKFYLITPDYAFGHALEAGVKDVLDRNGGSIVGNDLTPLGTTDFSPYLTKIEAAKPDAVMVLVQGNDYVNCLKQANSFGLIKKFPFGGPQAELEPLWSLPPEARAGFWGVEWYYKSDITLGKNNKAAHAFVRESMARYKKPPTARNCFGYITLDRLLWAMNESKTVPDGKNVADSMKVARALENARFNTIFDGEAYFRKEDHQLMWPMWVAEIRPNGTPGDKLDIFNVVDKHDAREIEQSVADKAKVCKMEYPT